MHAAVLGLSRIMAILGGATLSALVLLTCLSIAGRTLNGWLHADAVQAVAPALANGLLGLGIGPIEGDFELTEAGMAFVIFAFLPWCQITGGHASVDVFSRFMSARVNRALVWLGEVAFAAVLILIAVQLGAGMLSKLRTGQTTFLIQFPVWWSYALALSGAVVAAGVATHIAVLRSVEIATGRCILPPPDGTAT